MKGTKWFNNCYSKNESMSTNGIGRESWINLTGEYAVYRADGAAHKKDPLIICLLGKRERMLEKDEANQMK